jgi:Fe-S oxidoreductase
MSVSTEETREILWNAPDAFHWTLFNPFGLFRFGLAFLLFAVWGLSIAYPLWRWYRIVRLGRAENRLDQLWRRARRALFEGVGQGRVVREPAGVAHQILFVSFVVLFIGTALITIEEDTPLDFYYGAFYGGYKFMMDLAGVGLVLSSSWFLYRRFVAPPRALEQPAKMVSNAENETGYGFPLVMLWLIGVTGFLLEGSRIVAEPRSSDGLAFIGPLFADGFRALGAGVGTHYAIWCVHLLIVLSFLYAMTSTKLRHMFIGPLNIFFKPLDQGYAGGYRARPITDFETTETFGVEKIEEYTWKQLLDMAACLECGRCTLNCPTVNTQKALNPKHLVIEQREHLLAKSSFLFAQLAKFAAASNGDGDAAAAGAGGPGSSATGGDVVAGDAAPSAELLDGSGRDVAWLAQADMIRDVATEPVIWGCTTCGWCEEGCPVAIEHIQRIVDMRQHAVLVRSEFPADLAKSFKATETQSNPWGIASDTRAAWAEGLGVAQMAELGEDERVEVLYWVGCAGSFDDRNQKTSRALVKIMKTAGIKFGILGQEEQCTGEPARRLGNEYLYFTLAQMNVETLNRYKFDKIVTQCPHCFNTIKNEYPDLGGRFTVLHTAQFIESLLEAGRIKLSKDFLHKKLVLHDPCYLARHNNVHEAPRAVLDAIPGMNREDVENSRRRTFCCGAGGGQFWKEEEHGTPRINVTRLDQLLEAKPDAVAVACPFCTTMIGDATKARGLEEQVVVKDVVELVADSLV